MNAIQIQIHKFSYKPRVLIIDDEVRIQSACKRLLDSEGCEVMVAGDGIKGLEMIQENHFDIILLDLMMPGMSGMDVLTDVKSSHPDTVVIVITGYATIEHSIEAMKKGAFDFLPKPFSPDEIRLSIAKAIDFLYTLQDIVSERSRMRAMINTLNNGVLTTDTQKRIALANPSFLKAIGCKKRKVLGLNVSDIISETWLEEMIDEAMNEPSETFEEVTREVTLAGWKSSEETIWGVRSIPFRDRLQRTLGSVTVFQDITESKKKDQSKSDFVSMVAHEINSPLNSVLMQLNVILDGLAGELTEKQADILGRSADRIRSVTALSKELLDLSKIESGLINQERQSMDLTELLKEQVQSYEAMASEKFIVFDMDPDIEPLTIMGNRLNIEEVVSNLISNAIRYSPDGGKITIALEPDGDCAVLSVSDTGLGIPQDSIEHIFDRFFRVKTEQTRHINGTGLGLAIVKSIIDAHQGTIEVSSTEGKGTQFSVYLPMNNYTVE
jgi:two-component system phosphate regulon sensor histidine kinase PhoR